MGWYEFTEEGLSQELTYLDSAGLKAGQAYKRVSRTAITRYNVGGDITLEHYDKGTTAASGKGMGFWWYHALGSTTTGATQTGGTASTAYRQIHTPGTKDGRAFTTQIGRPESISPFTVRPFTYRGCKITQWEFSVKDGEFAMLKLTLDGWKESVSTGLVSPSYAGSGYQPGIFSFADVSTFTLGGTVTTSGGITSVASGTNLASLVKEITITGETPLADDRYGLGNAGVKVEQLHNGIPTVTGKLTAEFGSRTELYDLFANGTTSALQLVFTHGQAFGTANPFKLGFILPAIKLKEGSVNVDGPDIIGQDISFEAYDDGSTNPVVQVDLVSTDQVI